ncbi:uncharacterized protein MJAP1_003053 [Malassezia japonica]|uniref:JAB1/MPN/MOV34 metalloenzyme domain-containing protein n=1 Tax=Malassezia japonica TaxID=223818 RepID=A0AAF0F551_9BASI|nr:uncharacterized protein MJAP1_003053 [Malassezia japonica]WFD40069.1 hypothetical protein MJAP1_003053 [Malassezia japonica]
MDDGQGAARGARIVVHALPMLIMAEHLVRTSLENDGQTYGALLGTSSPSQIEVHNAFEVASADGTLDTQFLAKRQDQYEQVFPQWEVLGWYSVGTTLPQQHAAIQQQVEVLTPAPIVLVLDPSQAACAKANEQGTLPFTAYEPQGTDLVPCTLALGTAPVERVVLNDANSRALNTSDDAAAPGADHAVLASLQAERAATQILRDRLREACAYVEGVQRGTYPHDDRILRTLAAAVANQGSAVPPAFTRLESRIHEDAALTTYLADLTTNLHHLHELVEASAFHAPRARGV